MERESNHNLILILMGISLIQRLCIQAFFAIIVIEYNNSLAQFGLLANGTNAEKINYASINFPALSR